MKTPDAIKRRLDLCRVESGTCEGCPYFKDEHCISNGNWDALAYIRQLEAKLAEYEKPLVPMTLDEAKKLKGVWIEDDGCYWDDDEPTAHPAMYFARFNGHLMAFIGEDYMEEEELAYFEESDYGKTWRYWSRRPTDEERKAAKWDE